MIPTVAKHRFAPVPPTIDTIYSRAQVEHLRSRLPLSAAPLAAAAPARLRCPRRRLTVAIPCRRVVVQYFIIPKAALALWRTPARPVKSLYKKPIHGTLRRFTVYEEADSLKREHEGPQLTDRATLAVGKLFFLNELRSRMARSDLKEDRLAVVTNLSRIWGWPLWLIAAVMAPRAAFRRA